jgi:uncharacterized membrane protein HdeD (DUF308 family)
VLRFNLTSVTTIGILYGVVILIAGINEFMAAFVAPGWASGHFLGSAALLIAGVGISAMMRGVTKLIPAFHMRRAVRPAVA